MQTTVRLIKVNSFKWYQLWQNMLYGSMDILPVLWVNILSDVEALWNTNQLLLWLNTTFFSCMIPTTIPQLVFACPEYLLISISIRYLRFFLLQHLGIRSKQFIVVVFLLFDPGILTSIGPIMILSNCQNVYIIVLLYL